MLWNHLAYSNQDSHNNKVEHEGPPPRTPESYHEAEETEEEDTGEEWSVLQFWLGLKETESERQACSCAKSEQHGAEEDKEDGVREVGDRSLGLLQYEVDENNTNCRAVADHEVQVVGSVDEREEGTCCRQDECEGHHHRKKNQQQQYQASVESDHQRHDLGKRNRNRSTCRNWNRTFHRCIHLVDSMNTHFVVTDYPRAPLTHVLESGRIRNLMSGTGRIRI